VRETRSWYIVCIRWCRFHRSEWKELISDEVCQYFIPAFNEESAVQLVVAELRKILQRHGVCGEIIVVDDGSTDATARAAAAASARVIRHRSNRGYRAALKTGIAASTHDIVL